MPTRRLSRELIRKLHLLIPRIERRFAHYPIVDSRHLTVEPNPFESFFRGERVREINLSRHADFPVVVKRVHDLSAQKTIDRITQRVIDHNRRVHSTRYQLVVPHAYALGRDHVLMEKVSIPTLEEAVEPTSPAARLFVSRLLKKSGLTLTDLQQVTSDAVENSGIRADNLFLVGVRRKKFVIVPLLDFF